MNDPIRRLRAANPVPDAVSHPSDPRVVATLEEILVSTDETTPTTASDTTDATGAGRPSVPRRWLAAAVAAGVLAVAGIAVAVAADDDPGTGEEATARDAGDDSSRSDPDGSLPGDVVDPGGSDLSMCIAYDLEALADREYAFDGTVASVDGPTMTFDVHEWFRGGDGALVTLQHQDLAGMLFAPEGPALEPGTRVLAAGDADLLWSCGFTQLHDDALAARWRAALAG